MSLRAFTLLLYLVVAPLALGAAFWIDGADAGPTKKPNGPAVHLQRQLNAQAHKLRIAFEEIKELELELADTAGALYVFQSCTGEMPVEFVQNEGDPDYYMVEAPATPQATYMLMLDPECRR